MPAHILWLETARKTLEVHRLRSTQFDDSAEVDEAPEQHRTRNLPSVCETLKRQGYECGEQVKLYGQVFELASDPFSVAENVVFVDAVERKSGQFRRVRIPRTIIQMAKMKNRAG